MGCDTVNIRCHNPCTSYAQPICIAGAASSEANYAASEAKCNNDGGAQLGSPRYIFEHSILGAKQDEAANSSFWEGVLVPLDGAFWTYETGGNLCFTDAETKARTNLLIQFDGQNFSCAHSVWDPTDHSRNKLFFTCKIQAMMNEALEVLDETFVPSGSMISPVETLGVIQHFLCTKGERDPKMQWEDAENIHMPGFD